MSAMYRQVEREHLPLCSSSSSGLGIVFIHGIDVDGFHKVRLDQIPDRLELGAQGRPDMQQDLVSLGDGCTHPDQGGLNRAVMSQQFRLFVSLPSRRCMTVLFGGCFTGTPMFPVAGIAQFSRREAHFLACASALSTSDLKCRRCTHHTSSEWIRRRPSSPQAPPRWAAAGWHLKMLQTPNRAGELPVACADLSSGFSMAKLALFSCESPTICSATPRAKSMPIDQFAEHCRNRCTGITLRQTNPIPGASALKCSGRPRGAFTRGRDRRVLDVLGYRSEEHTS